MNREGLGTISSTFSSMYIITSDYGRFLREKKLFLEKRSLVSSSISFGLNTVVFIIDRVTGSLCNYFICARDVIAHVLCMYQK